MAFMAPPQPPTLVAVGDNDGLRRVRFRLWQLMTTAVTVGLTAWIASFGWIPAILALMVAKHVLVALLMIGLDNEPART